MRLMAFFLLLAGISGEKEDEIEKWVQQAWEKNPEIVALQADYEADLRQIPVAKTLPDPQIGVMLQNESSAFSLGKMPMSMFGFSVSQMFPYPGKLSLMGEMAHQEAQMSYARWQKAKNALRAKVKRNLYQLALTLKLKEIYLEMKNVVKSLSETVAGMYASGMVPQQDVFLAQLQIYEIEQKILEQERKEKELRAEFVHLLGRSISLDFPVIPLPEEIPYPPEAGKLYEIALKWSPMIQM
ncbi:MAG: TolC family protein, partial [bacterium]